MTTDKLTVKTPAVPIPASQSDRGKVSKSLIVEISLLTALEELRDKSEKSQLASMLVSQ